MGRLRIPLLWFPVWKALVFFEGVKRGSNTVKNLARLEEGSATTKATGTFEKWAQRQAEKAYDLTFPKGKRHWFGAGKVHRIDYWSDKWGDDAEYTHDFQKGVKLYVLQKGPKSAMWVIRGGRMTVTKRGIER